MEIPAPEIDHTANYVLNLCSAIGGLEEIMLPDGTIGRVYAPGDEALACLRDLKKAIRIDSQNSERTVLGLLTEHNIVQTDIVPLLLSFQHNQDEVAYRFILACVELLVPMTWPVDNDKDKEDEDEDMPEDPSLMDHYRKYKYALLTPGVFEAVLALVVKSIAIPHKERSLVDHTTIRLCLYLFRNLTAITDLNTSQSATAAQLQLATLQENLMIRYWESDVMELLLTIASNSHKQSDMAEWHMLVLESIYNILKYVDPKDVLQYHIKKGLERGTLGQKVEKLNNLLKEERIKKRQRTPYVPSRHNRFGGTYSFHWDGKRKISHVQVAGFADEMMILEEGKKDNRVGMKRKMADMMNLRKAYHDGKAYMFLKLTAQSFISTGFNALFSAILKDMQREDKNIVKKDFARFYYTITWFLEYYRYEQQATVKRKQVEEEQELQTENFDQDFDFGLVATALDLKALLYTLRSIRIKLDDKEWFDVQMAVDCFKQMLLTISLMSKSKNTDYQKIAEHIQSNLFYEQAHLDLFVELVKGYKNQSYSYLKTIIMTTHVLLTSLDDYQKNKKILFVRKKAKMMKSKKKKNQTEEDLIAVTSDEESEQEQATHREQEFQFAAFEKKYISTDVIKAYCTLLEQYMELEPIYMTCITKMFHRIMVKHKCEFLFWKLPVLYLFNRILKDQNRVAFSKPFEELKTFIRYSTYQFFKAAKQYPLLFVEALVPKLKSDRHMWEVQDTESFKRAQQARREEQNYMADVNYIPSTSTERPARARTTSRSPTPNYGIIDEGMQDYLFSAFDRRKEDEEAARARNNKEVEALLMASDEEEDSHLNTRNKRRKSNSSRVLDQENYDDTIQDHGLEKLEASEVNQLLDKMGIN